MLKAKLKSHGLVRIEKIGTYVISYNPREKRNWVLRLLLALDQFLNVLIFNGYEDHTISGRVGYKALMHPESKLWNRLQKMIDTLFFFDKGPNGEGHCFCSIEWSEVPVIPDDEVFRSQGYNVPKTRIQLRKLN